MWDPIVSGPYEVLQILKLPYREGTDRHLRLIVEGSGWSGAQVLHVRGSPCSRASKVLGISSLAVCLWIKERSLSLWFGIFGNICMWLY